MLNSCRHYLADKVGLIFCIAILLLGAVVYYPGINGPFIFDDFQNIVGNRFLRIDKLQIDSLLSAALSTDSGPLKRPIAMVSFALNNYFSGGNPSALAIKATNIGLHAFNGILVFCFLKILLDGYLISTSLENREGTFLNHRNSTLIAGWTALLWVSHPIQVSSVLYAVQRMTSLSATFVLLALIFYMVGRIRLKSKKSFSAGYLVVVPSLFFLLSILSKETGFLLPLYIAVIEYTVFNPEPRILLKKIPGRKIQLFSLSIVLALIAVCAYLLILNASKGYFYRPFTMAERLLTEARVVIYYVYLILVPNITKFALHHDYIPISNSIFSPITTALSIISILGTVAFAVIKRKRYTLAAFCILWFIIGHSLESSIYPLEIAHEHRNYLPSIGAVLGMILSVYAFSANAKNRRLLLLVPVIIFLYSSVTFLRSHHWSNANSLYAFEVLHHPDSARSQLEYSNVLARQGEFHEAIAAVTRASELSPQEPGYLMDILYLQAISGIPIDKNIHRKIVNMLADVPLSSFLTIQLDSLGKCVTGKCHKLGELYEEWLTVLTTRESKKGDVALFHYLLGKYYHQIGNIVRARQHFIESTNNDRKFIHPLFSLATIYIQSNRFAEAKQVLKRIKHMNRKYKYRWHSEIDELDKQISDSEFN